MGTRGRPRKPAEKLNDNARLVRLNDERDAMLLAVAAAKGVAPATLMRVYILRCLNDEVLNNKKENAL